MSAGCAHIQLRNHTLRQAGTAADMQYQQVLDNLAMFVVNPDSMPFFSVPGIGGTKLDTTGEASNTTVWGPLGFLTDAFAVKANRTKGGSWTLATINDPAKLVRMRCAFQIAVGYHLDDNMQPCRECCKLISAWYGEDIKACGQPCRVPPPGWYSVGCKHDVPKDACYVGHYCDTYVWVLPGGVEDLTRLTLTILDFATAASGYTGPPSPKQQVVRKWEPVYREGAIVDYRLKEVTTTVMEPQVAGGSPVAPRKAAADRLPPPEFLFDRPRDNYFNPVLPQLELVR